MAIGVVEVGEAVDRLVGGGMAALVGMDGSRPSLNYPTRTYSTGVTSYMTTVYQEAYFKLYNISHMD